MNQVHIIWIWVVPTVYALTLILTWIFPLADVELTTSSKSPFITITLEPAILIRTCSTWRTISRILINTNYTQLAIKTAFRLASKLLDRPRVTKTNFLTWTFVNIRFASWTGPEITATALKIIIRCNGTFTVILTRIWFTWIGTSYFYDFISLWNSCLTLNVNFQRPLSWHIKSIPEYETLNPDNVADPSEVKMSSTGPVPSNILSKRTSFKFCPQTVCSFSSFMNRITNLSKLHSVLSSTARSVISSETAS